MQNLLSYVKVYNTEDFGSVNHNKRYGIIAHDFSYDLTYMLYMWPVNEFYPIQHNSVS